MPAIYIPTNFFIHDAQSTFFPSTHINPGLDIDGIINSDGLNILIQGIRGTGKTHILKMIATKCFENFSDIRVLPVYFSLSTLSWIDDNQIDRYKIHLCSSIVKEAILTIENNKKLIKPIKSEKDSLKVLQQMFGLKNNDVAGLLSDIKAKYTELMEGYTSTSSSIKDVMGQDGESRFDSNLKTPVKLEFGFSKKKSESYSHQVAISRENLQYKNAPDLLFGFFNSLKDLLGLRYVFLLLDECNIVDRNKQMEVFKLLKLIRSGSSQSPEKNTVYFCASFYPPFATQYPSTSRGNDIDFQPGQDARPEYLQMNELSISYISFFKELTRRRLEHSLKKNEIKDPITEIFAGEDAFLLSAYCSNGIPRRYLEILLQSYNSLKGRTREKMGPDEKISFGDVNNAVSLVVSEQIRPRGALKRDDESLLDHVIHMILTKKRNSEGSSIYFTVNKTQADKFTNLLLSGCIHDKGMTRYKTDFKIPGFQGSIFMLDSAISYASEIIDQEKSVDFFKNLSKSLKQGTINHYVIPYRESI